MEYENRADIFCERKLTSTQTRMSWDMKRIAIASAGFLLTFGLAIFAIAVAQRDSRERVSVLDRVEPDYAHQKPEPIAFPVASDVPKKAPKSFLRTIVEPIMQAMPDDGAIAPLDSSPSEQWPHENFVKTLPLDQSQLVLAAGQEAAPPENRGLVPPPGLLSAPPIAGLPKLTNPMPATGSPQNLPASPFATGGPPAMLDRPTAAIGNAPVNSNGLTPPKFPLTERLDQLSSPPSITNPLPLPAPQTNNTAGLPGSAFNATDSNPQGYTPLASPYSSPAGGSLPSLKNGDLEPASRREAATLVPAKMANANKPGMMMLASAAPGARQMDGAQTPSLQIQKRGPEEAQVGQPTTFALLVRNVSNTTAYEVSVVDSVPRGTRLSKTTPPAESRSDGTLVWSLGEMAAGSEQVLSIEVIPETEGEIGSVASVNFTAQASVRTVSTQPKLTIKQVADNKILLGKPLRIRVTVANEGTGVARGVSLEEDVPSGLRHPSGDFLGAPFGDLVPGQSRTIELELMTVKPGLVRNQMRAVAANSARSDSSVDVEVVAPKLAVSVVGPGLRYLERQATYQVSVTNQGTSMAQNVEIIANLPRGLQYNSSGDKGEYRTDQHAVSWGLEELAVGATATTELTLLPVEDGEFTIRVQSQAIGVQSEPFDKPIRIEGQSELAFSIDDDNDPVEVDGQTTYTVQLTNTGTRVDEDVQVMIELPKGAKVLQVHGPVGFKETAQGLLFDPIAQMRAKDQQTFRFSVQLSQNGVQVVRAHVKSKLRPIAVVKEESTEVYRDQ